MDDRVLLANVVEMIDDAVNQNDYDDNGHEMKVQGYQGRFLFLFVLGTLKHPKFAEIFEKEIHPTESGFVALSVPLGLLGPRELHPRDSG